MAVSKRLRYEVLRRDNHACRYCGGVAPDVKLTVDHVVPVALGGGDDPSNLVAACRDCNAGKSASSPDSAIVDDVAQDALRWAAAIKAAQALREQTYYKMLEHRDYVWQVWVDRYGDDHYLHDGYGTSVDAFIAAGLGYSDFEDAADIAVRSDRKDPWAYFCGVCWRKVAELQEIARGFLDAGTV